MLKIFQGNIEFTIQKVIKNLENYKFQAVFDLSFKGQKDFWKKLQKVRIS